MESSQSSLIPCLTDDVAELCLSRIPHSGFRIIAQVCRRWRTFLRSEHFSAVRKLTGAVEEFTCVLMESQFVRDGRFVKYLFGEVFDVSGAGDTTIALFTLALCAGAAPAEAAEIANQASGIVVGKLGTATVSPAELLASFEADLSPLP